MYGRGMETYFAKGSMTCFGERFVFRVENSPLTNNSSEHICEDRSFASVAIVRKRETLLETAFTIGRDHMCQASDDKFTKFRLLPRNARFLQRRVRV